MSLDIVALLLCLKIGPPKWRAELVSLGESGLSARVFAQIPRYLWMTSAPAMVAAADRLALF
jgi:hypothetical protein